MENKLTERVLKAVDLVFEHRDAAMQDHSLRALNEKHKVEEYLWKVLNRMGITDTELGFKFIEKRLVTSKDFHDCAKSLKSVWRKVVWDIIAKGSIQWPTDRLA